MSSLEFQYNLSKMKFLQKPSRMFSFRDRENTSFMPAFLPNLDEMKRVFENFDSNKDGNISLGECKAILQAPSKENTIKEVPKILKAVVLDGDGFIDFKEFVILHKREGGVTTMDIQCPF